MSPRRRIRAHWNAADWLLVLALISLFLVISIALFFRPLTVRTPTTSPAQSLTPTSTPVPSGVTVDLRSYGAVCNGVADDRPAVVRALGALSAMGGGILLVPNANCRMVQTATSVFTGIDANTAIVGAGAKSRFSLACDSSSGYRELFRVDGSNVIFQDIALVRVTGCSGIMVALHPPLSAFTMKNVVMDGAARYGGEMSAIIQPNLPSGTYSNIKLVGTTIKNFTDYGYFQPNEAVTSTDTVVVDGCTFKNNGADDLEFNAPAGTMKNLTITNSSFSYNRSKTTSAGFGIGIANAQNVMISNNTFDTYNYEPIHIEDRSSHVTIQDNTFLRSSTVPTNWSSHIFIVSGSQFITIQRNHFDTSSNTNRLWVIYMGPGGTNYPAPTDITIQNNTFILGRKAVRMSSRGIRGLVVTDNLVTRGHGR